MKREESTPPQGKGSPHEITLQALLESIQDAPDLKSIKRTLSRHIRDIFQVEMASIFLVNTSKEELDSWLLLPGDSLEKIVVPMGTGSIVGFVATKKIEVNLADPYDFQQLRRVGFGLNFSDKYDKQANIRTKQVLAIPIVDDNTLMGVVELINKRDDTQFSNKEQHEVKKLAQVLADAFLNHNLFSQQIPPKYESLLAQKLLSRKELIQGLAKATELGEDPDTVLMKDFQIPRLKMGKLLAEFYSTSFMDLEKVDSNPKKIFSGVNIGYFEKEELVPLSLDNGKLVVAVKNVEDQTLASAIREKVPRVKQVELVFAFQEDIRSFWKRTRQKYPSGSSGVSIEPQSSLDTSLFDLVEEKKPQEKVKGQRVTYEERRVRPEKRVEKRPEPRVYKGPEKPVGKKPEKPVDINDDINAPTVVQMVNKIIDGGYSSQASDIHIEPYGHEENGEVRYRIDGVCSNAFKIPRQYVRQVVDRIKYLASLKLDERIRPQCGTVKFTTSEGKEIELRVATIPTADRNDDIVLRIIPEPKPLPVLDELMPSRVLAPLKEIIDQEQGLILVVGPNASGKTTTLHSFLAHLNTAEKKIWTAEYPVEIKQHRIRQVQVDPLVNYTFADALRAFLRADPDVIMIGDMQDLQTAVMAVNAAQNGHLLLSSLPAKSVKEGITHCLDMGLNPSNLAAALQGVMAQRLVRTLCEDCKESYHPERDEYDRLLENYGISFYDHINVMYRDDLVFYRAKGCPRCNDSGYLGRMGLYELLAVNPTIRKLIINREPVDDIIDEAMVNGMILLLQEGIQLVFDGTIDCKELMSIFSL